MEAAFLVGPNITTGVDHDPTFFTHTIDSNTLVDQVANLNPTNLVLNGHGNSNGEIHLFSEADDATVHPVEIARRIMANSASKGRRPNLRVLEAYGCSIGAGISTEAATAALDDPTANVALYRSFCLENPDVLCVVNAGSNMIFGSDSDIDKSLTEPNPFKLVISKILNRAETFKVLSGKSGEFANFKFSALRPQRAEDLTDDALKDFLITRITDFADFYSQNIRKLTTPELEFYNQTKSDLTEKPPQELSALRRKYAEIEAQRGNVAYLRHYLAAGVKADNSLLRDATVFGSMETVRFLHKECGLEINPVFGRSPLELAAKNCNFSTVSYLCQNKVRLKDSLSLALSSRLAHGKNFLKTVAILVANGAELESKDREAFERAQAGEPNLLSIMLIASRIEKLPKEEKALELAQLLACMDDGQFLRRMPRAEYEESIKWPRFSKPKFSSEACVFGEILHDSFKDFYSDAETAAKTAREAEEKNAVVELLAREGIAWAGDPGAERKYGHEIRRATAVAFTPPATHLRK